MVQTITRTFGYYYRKGGIYVSPHYRSNPNGSVRNNWSTYPNINPYTGEQGTKYKYSLPAPRTGFSLLRYDSRIETFYRNYKLEVRQSIQPGDLVWVKVEGANIRGNPTTVNSKVIDVAGRFVGLVVLYRSENGNWFRVKSPNGKYGWISRVCITKDYSDTLR
jgi:hypothetical protein